MKALRLTKRRAVRRVAARANLSAPSIASVPELQKKTASRCGRRSLRQRLGQQPAEERAIHLHHVGQIEIEHVADRFLHRGMVPTDIENAVAAQEIEVGGIIHVVEVGALGPRIDLVEPDDALRGDERAIEVPLMQLVIFAEREPRQFPSGQKPCRMVCDLRRNANLGFPVAMSNEGAGLQIRLGSHCGGRLFRQPLEPFPTLLRSGALALLDSANGLELAATQLAPCRR